MAACAVSLMRHGPFQDSSRSVWCLVIREMWLLCVLLQTNNVRHVGFHESREEFKGSSLSFRVSPSRDLFLEVSAT